MKQPNKRTRKNIDFILESFEEAKETLKEVRSIGEDFSSDVSGIGDLLVQINHIGYDGDGECWEIRKGGSGDDFSSFFSEIKSLKISNEYFRVKIPKNRLWYVLQKLSNLNISISLDERVGRCMTGPTLSLMVKMGEPGNFIHISWSHPPENKDSSIVRLSHVVDYVLNDLKYFDRVKVHYSDLVHSYDKDILYLSNHKEYVETQLSDSPFES